MKWLVILFIIMFLVGTLMWVRPTPRQRFQARLREKARQLGFQVRLCQLQLPRAQGELEAETRLLANYSLTRTNLDKAERQSWQTWSVARVSSINNVGLPQNWSWHKRPDGIENQRVEKICNLLETMPPEVVAVESTPVQFSVFWRESESLPLEQLKQFMDNTVADKV